MKINTALFGFGRIGQMHADNLNHHKSFNLKYIFDIDKKLKSKVRKYPNCQFINNYKISLADKKIDLIFIATSTATHTKYIEEALRHKKYVFCEKPLDLNLDKIIKSKKKIKKNIKKVQLGFNRRFDPGHADLKKYLVNNKIGKLEKIIITSRDPAPPSIQYLKSSGGIFKDMMIHDFDLSRFYLANDPIKEITATGSNFLRMYDRIKDHEIASVIMKSKKGVIVVINNSRHASYGYDQRVELFGTKGMVISGNKHINETELFNSSTTSSKKVLPNFFIDRYQDAYKLQLDELSKLCNYNLIPRSTFDDGLEALKLAEAAIKSLKLKKTIKL